MKKHIATVLALLLAVCMLLAACGEEPEQPTDPAVSSDPTTATSPDATEPSATKPQETQPDPTEPSATQPQATQPAPTEPPATQPAPTEPPATQPAPTEPVHTHSWGQWETVQAATCTADGSQKRACQCGETQTEAIAKLGHTKVTDSAVAPTCTKDGLTEGSHCSVCNAVLDAQTAVAATGHTFGNWETVKQPTCTAEGSKKRACQCGESETEAIAKLGHTKVTDSAVAPTCTKDGLTEGSHCSVCSAVLDAQTAVPATGHTYNNGECACGALQNPGKLQYINNVNLKDFYWSNGSGLAGKNENGCYLYDLNGNVLSGPYDYMLCHSPDGYIVAQNEKVEIINEYINSDTGKLNRDEKTTLTSYVLDSNGNIVYESTCIEISEAGRDFNYEGEIILYCSEGRIITLKWNLYWDAMMHRTGTLYIRDLKGNLIAEFKGIISCSNLVDGKLTIFAPSTAWIVDKNGKVLKEMTLYDRFPAVLSNTKKYEIGSHMKSYTNGYLSFYCASSWGDKYAILLNESDEKHYVLNQDYLYRNENYGTLIFSKVIQNGVVSDGYYLIDAAKCPVDENGVVIPTIDAAVCKTPVASGSITNVFGRIEKYMLIKTMDGKWAYMTYDGTISQTYDDACGFENGYAMVKSGDKFCVIDENFRRVSDYVTGYDSCTTVGSGIFTLNKEGNRTPVLFTPGA